MDFITISANSLDNYIYDPDTIIIDLRSSREYNICHIKNAVNIEYNNIQNKLYILDKYKNVILYCERGSISMIVAKNLGKKSYQIMTVVGGIKMYRGKNNIYQNKNKSN